MSGQTEENKDKSGEAPPGGGTTTTPDPKTQQPPTGAQPPKSDAKAGGKDKDESDDEPKPDDKGMVTMPLNKFLKRVSRMSNKRLREVFGTDDLSAIAAERKELEDHRKEKADREKAAMTEKDKREAELKTEREKREAAEKRATEAEDRAAMRETGRDLKDVALEFVAKEDVEDILDKLAGHVRRNPDAIENTEDAKEWLKEFVEKNPKWAKASDKKDDKKAEEKKPIDNGAKGAKPKAPPSGGGDNSQEKTARPGQANSMTKSELKKAFNVDY